SRAANLITLVNFCSEPNCADGGFPDGLIADSSGNLFGTTFLLMTADGIVFNDGTVFEVVKTSGGYATSPKTLVSFDGIDGSSPSAGLLADASGNLFGTTAFGGKYGYGLVFEVVKTSGSYATSPKTLVSFNN